MGRVPRRAVNQLLECLGLRVQELLQGLQAVEAVLADGDQLAVQGLEGLEGAQVRHGRRGEGLLSAFSPAQHLLSACRKV